MSGLQRSVRQAVAAWPVAAALSVLALAAQAADAPLPAHGLIVKLREASASQRAFAQGASSQGADADDTATLALQRADRAQRLRSVMVAAGLPEATLRASGRAAHHLGFGRVLDGAEAARLAAVLRARPEVEWVVPNERERRLQYTSEPLFSSQWWLQSVRGSSGSAIVDRMRGVPGFQSAWVTSAGTPAAVVAVLDTGITAHPDLDSHVLPGYDFVSDIEYANDGDGRDPDASDPGDWVSADDRRTKPALFGTCQVGSSTWHGTEIAGLVAAVSNNGLGGAAASLNGRVVPVRVAGKCGAMVDDIVAGMRWAAGLQLYDAQDAPLPLNRNPARIINISFGGSAACNALYQDAIDEIAAKKGAVVVAAAGNERGAVTRPASCNGVIGVAAVNRDGFKANYSNFGAKVVVSTVGGDPREDGAWGGILGDDGLLVGVDNFGSTFPDTVVADYSRLFGTSFAAPLAAGTLSLMLSINPLLTSTQLIEGLKVSARPHVISSQMGICSSDNPGRCLCTTSTCGAGLLDATQAVQYARNPQGYVRATQAAAVSIDNADVNRALALGADEPPNVTAAATDDKAGGALGGGWLFALALAVALVASKRAQGTA